MSPDRNTYIAPSRPLGNQGADTHASRPKKFVAKGHDAQLQEAQYGKFTVTVTPISDPDLFYTGHITRRDKYTVTILNPLTGIESIIYKHAIEAIQIDRTPKDH